MIIFNQIEHLKKLNENMQYKEVVQYANITLHITLKEKRYAEALICYELLANATYGIGDMSRFCMIMMEFEKLCLIHGKIENKMSCFYLLSTLNGIVDNEESIQASKKSILYASSLNDLELYAVNYANIAANLAFIGQIEQAHIAAKLATYYKEKINNPKSRKVETCMGLLYYYAATNNDHQFVVMKNELLQFSGEIQSVFHTQIAFSEATILAQQRKFHLSGIELQKVYVIFKEQQNMINLHLLYKIINRDQLQNYFESYDELHGIIQAMDVESILYTQIRSMPYNMAMDEVSASYTYKYPGIHTKKSMKTYVNELLQANKNLYCLHWSFITDEIETLFGTQFVEQLLYEIFDSIYKVASTYEADFLIFSHKEGEFIVKEISNDDFFVLIMELEQQLQSVAVHLTMGSVEIPIHFGFVDSECCPEGEVTYEKLITHADARLYYAKSHGQLYMFS